MKSKKKLLKVIDIIASTLNDTEIRISTNSTGFNNHRTFKLIIIYEKSR